MFSDVLDFLKNNSAYGSAVMVFFITKVFSIAKERQSNIAHANAEYSNVLINYIVDGKKPSMYELELMKRQTASNWKVHISRMESMGEGLVRARCAYMSNPSFSRIQREQFIYNYNTYGIHYRDKLVVSLNKKNDFLKDWGITTIFVFSVWMLDSFLFSHIKLDISEKVILLILAGIFSLVSNLISNFVIWFFQKRIQRKREKEAWRMISELSRIDSASSISVTRRNIKISSL